MLEAPAIALEARLDRAFIIAPLTLSLPCPFSQFCLESINLRAVQHEPEARQFRQRPLDFAEQAGANAFLQSQQLLGIDGLREHGLRFQQQYAVGGHLAQAMPLQPRRQGHSGKLLLLTIEIEIAISPE